MLSAQPAGRGRPESKRPGSDDGRTHSTGRERSRLVFSELIVMVNPLPTCYSLRFPWACICFGP